MLPQQTRPVSCAHGMQQTISWAAMYLLSLDHIVPMLRPYGIKGLVYEARWRNRQKTEVVSGHWALLAKSEKRRGSAVDSPDVYICELCLRRAEKRIVLGYSARAS